jgi:hypothetical protein
MALRGRSGAELCNLLIDGCVAFANLPVGTWLELKQEDHGIFD